MLANDIDPAGGVLVVQGVDVPADSGLAVTVLEHRLVRVTNVAGITDPVTLKYRVSNGAMNSESEIMVMPDRSAREDRRACGQGRRGGSARGRHRDGRTCSTTTHLPRGRAFHIGGLADPFVDPAVAEVFVSDKVLRIKAGQTPGQYKATYWIVDELGQRAAAI